MVGGLTVDVVAQAGSTDERLECVTCDVSKWFVHAVRR